MVKHFSGQALLLALCALTAACSRAARQPDVVLVVADTLRADKLGCYGNEAGLTPELDRFAERAVVFEHATSHAPWTLPATASLLTSLYPQQHGAGGKLPDFTRLAPSVETLQERFAAAGYQTHAIVNVAFLGETFGLTRGFDDVDAQFFSDNVHVRSATETTDAALTWLAQRDEERPAFLLVHYFDAHAVYAPPQPFRRRFAAEPDREDERFVFGTRSHMMALRAGQLELDERVIRRAERLYDGEVAYMDGQIGRLLDGLREAPETVVAFTADHGEEFLDHQGFEHGHTLYDELTHVPLIVRDARFAPRHVDAAVGHIDLAPTLCELVGLAPGPSYMGRSLVPLMEGRAVDEVPLLAHGNFWDEPLSSARLGDYKLIVGADKGDGELYDWRTDALEARDLRSERAEIAERLAEILADFARRAAQGGPGARVELSAEMAEQLESLGYGGGEER